MQHEHTEHVAAPADAVYAAISDLGNLPRFVPQMTAARPAAGDRVEVDARYEGRTQHGEVSFQKNDGERRIVWSAPSGYHGGNSDHNGNGGHGSYTGRYANGDHGSDSTHNADHGPSAGARYPAGGQGTAGSTAPNAHAYPGLRGNGQSVRPNDAREGMKQIQPIRNDPPTQAAIRGELRQH